jgi:putative transposase
MARQARLCVEGYSHHVLQRGNNRQSIFMDEQDYGTYLGLLKDALVRTSCELHAYALLSSQVHLILMPAKASSLSKLMQSIGRDYARYFNDRHARTGTLWEGRYRSTVIDSEHYLLPAMVYVDLSPVRAAITHFASEYQHTSYRHYAGIAANPLLSTPQSYWSLGNTPFARETAYRELVSLGLSPQQLEEITEKTVYGWPLGDEQFIRELAALMPHLNLSKKARGRPRLSSSG